ncbi:hypothetical protein JIP62_10555 [Brevundimonas vitis]|uniref:Uncharacterized protein n=1 Tax=Brevundimonas vitisensis TaxID=2800818 RepID=A0ABX7BM27_9CAUL|nr:hypothetical protein [Brevundimonas vitisensis]QQQ17773.1 hypothetical protein JIP62_10555 [Brevundimonas vitisensis]
MLPGYTPAATGGMQAEATMKVVAEVLAERGRQVAIGHTPARDDVYVDAELARGSAAYALNASRSTAAPLFWPWPGHTWQPAEARRDLIRSVALAIAEIERLDRAAAATVTA